MSAPTDKQVAHGRNLSPDQFHTHGEIRLTSAATAASNYTDSRVGRAFPASATVEHLDPHSLHPTQPIVYNDGVKDVRKHAANEPIEVIRHQGKDFIRDGHHRVVLAMQQGRTVPAHVTDVAAGFKRAFG